MKRFTLGSSMLIVLTTCFLSCKPTKEEATLIPSYAVVITRVEADNAPALQSFAHGVNGLDLLLFAGRTNSDSDNGGLHKINGNSNYSSTSFLPPSFNEMIYVYNLESNAEPYTMSMDEMVERLRDYQATHPGPGNVMRAIPQIIAALPTYQTIFRATNPQVTQDKNGFLYVIGGYGTPIGSDTVSSAYQTFNQVARIHVPSMINLVKNQNLDQIDWWNLIAFGQNSRLMATGGEVYQLGDTFYLSGGHNFGSSAPSASNGQQYQDAVYPFTLKVEPGTINLTIEVKTAITDVALTDLGTVNADTTSKFRRRDGPIVPALFYDSNKSLTEGLTFYGGVFQPSSKGVAPNENPDSTYNRAWNTAIYVHPAFGDSNPIPESPYYTLDSKYSQNNLNVYSCSDIEFYDATTKTVHTLLIGGIGDGETQVQTSMLSGFTNSLMHITYDLEKGTSTPKLESENIFNTDNFYGAESAFIYNSNANLVFTQVNGKTTEVIDANATFKSGQSVDVGYIYGGIEAFNAGPGTYGPGNSAASNKIWKVTVTKNTVNN
ncbi:hypothetical protein [Roseivirga echinicomitans]|uniref:Uncharacterized protein n=1 Tax=Roseivirga echinicomitans TaxID=296218 RepID=A0A150X9M3_9BACT|nr:hypothetical protein [Roseivirga echinicomitans]KYG75403.1 hypothetical protein AWN68_07590 [Roseivirga echinicomitans]